MDIIILRVPTSIVYKALVKPFKERLPSLHQYTDLQIEVGIGSYVDWCAENDKQPNDDDFLKWMSDSYD